MEVGFPEVFLFHLSAVNIFDGGLSEEEVDVVLVFDGAHEMRCCKKIIIFLLSYSILFLFYHR